MSPHARIVLATLRVAMRTAVAMSWRGATGEVLAITTAVYSYWAGARTANGPPGAFGWAILAVLLVISALGGWAVAAAIQRSWRRLDQGDDELPLLSPGAWGEPDLAAPSTSPQALAEVAELEALWRQSRRRRRAGTDLPFTFVDRHPP